MANAEMVRIHTYNTKEETKMKTYLIHGLVVHFGHLVLWVGLKKQTCLRDIILIMC